ncbi:MAG: asparagine synthetase B, partial [Candidatus Methylomirabilales bacterium]
MLARTKHRGPDSVGIYVDGQIHRGRNFSAIGKKGLPQYGRICLGHARLEIVGGAAGIQPLTGCDNRLTLVHNGEIYNYRELRPLLQNHEIKTGS